MATVSTNEPPSAVPPTANERFFRYFQHEVTDLQEQMSRIENHGTSGGERADAIDHCLSTISRLSGEVQGASSYLPPHDKRTYGETIKALQSKLQEVRATGLPRQKFSFKKSGTMFTTRKNEPPVSLENAAELARQKQTQLSDSSFDTSNTSIYTNTSVEKITPSHETADGDDPKEDAVQVKGEQGSSLETASVIQAPPFSTGNAITIDNHERKHIVLPTSASSATSSATVSNVKRCVIDMSSATAHGKPFATLTLKNITSSLIICGHINGAAHVTNIKNSVIVVASRQYRMHESSNCDIYLLTTSRPIIEDCAAIRFAPLPRSYTTEADEKLNNQWSNIDDFKWLRSEPSPHWSLLDSSKQILDKVWEEIVPGGLDLTVEDILNAASVPK